MKAPLWADPRHGGAGTWERTEPPTTSLRDLLIPLIVLLISAVLFVDLLVAGRALMCSSHGDTLSYCHPQPTATP